MSEKRLSRTPQPDSQSLSRLRALVLDSVTSPESKRAYARGIDSFLSWVQSTSPGTGFTKATVNAYRAHLLEKGMASGSVNLHLTAIRRLAIEAADNGLMASDLAAGIGRVKGVRREGIRTGNWLTKEQAEELINKPDISTLKGKRDRAMLALMIGSGLRRDEVANLCVEHIQQREGRWVIVDLMGKGRKVRSVPIPAFAKAAIDQYLEALAKPLFTSEINDHFPTCHCSLCRDKDDVQHPVATFTAMLKGQQDVTAGRLFRAINKGDRISGQTMTAQSIFETVKHYAALIGQPNLAPHDLRRTFAKLAHNGRAALEQIQLSLGHSSIQTTERYLGVRQDLTDAPCDHLGLKI